MEIVTIVLLCLFVILLAVLVCCIISGQQHMHLITNNYKNKTDAQNILQPFSVDVEFEELPHKPNVEVENQHDCNAESLTVCLMDDISSLFGCRELLVKCHHFDKDTPYMHNGIEVIIPANKIPNEGYALAIEVLVDSCNPYHGNLTLMTLDNESKNYMLLCVCKNPGYIGNTTLMGNCTTVHICDGNVVDINKPIDTMECVCATDMISVMVTDTLQQKQFPVCRELLIIEANKQYVDWSHLVVWPESYRRLNKQYFNATIRSNLNTTELLHPCFHPIDAVDQIMVSSAHNSTDNTCRFVDYGLPLTLGIFENRIHTQGKQHLITTDGALSTGMYQWLRFSDNIWGKRRIVAIKLLGLRQFDDYENQPVVVVPPYGLLLGKNQQISIETPARFIAPNCTPNELYLTYTCKISEYYKEHISNLAMPDYNSCPNIYLWSRDQWEITEETLHFGLSFEFNSPRTNTARFLKTTEFRPYGILWVNKKAPNEQNTPQGLLLFDSDLAYKGHINSSVM